MNTNYWAINIEEKALCKKCIQLCLNNGATHARVTLNKSLMSQIIMLNGELDKVSQNGDRALTFNIFANKRYGTFSINRLEEKELDNFIKQAINTTIMLEEDDCRGLPDINKTIKNAITGYELGLYDEAYNNMTIEQRLNIAKTCSKYNSLQKANANYSIISEEVVYSDSIYSNYIVDSNLLECSQVESSFEASIELTIEDKEGNKYTGYGWDASTHLNNITTTNLADIALNRAVRQIAPKEIQGGKYTMVVENEVASKLLNPILSSLNGFSIQQENSFLANSLGKKVFSEGFTLWDKSTEQGKNGARLFDSEGVAYKDEAIIENGVIKKFFINTYIAAKMQICPTTEDCARAKIMPYGPYNSCKDILKSCKTGIFVTGFNGGNSNSTSGDFSYGVEGYVFEDGVITKPVKGMVITGNFIDLWNNLLFCGNDHLSRMSKQIPTLAFKNVDFSA